MSSDRYTPNHGKNSSSQGWQYSSGSTPGNRGTSGGTPPKKPRFNISEWIPIIVLFCIPSGFTQIIALVWMLSKIANMVKANQAYRESLQNFGRAAADVTRDVTDAVRREVRHAQSSSAGKTQTSHAQASAQTASRAYSYAESARPASVNRKLKKPKGGTALVVLGIIFACSLGFSTLMTLIGSAPIGALVLGILTMASLAMLGGGIKLNRRKERMINYLAYIGTNREVGLVNMALSFGVSVKTLCKDLRKMLAEGYLPTGYLDLSAGKLFLTETGYQAPAPEREEAQSDEPQQTQSDDSSILKEIRQVNDDIPDEIMSAKIDRIEEITGKILNYQKTHPEKAGQLRSFLNYYLPTTLKILRAYAQLDAQGIEGENISAAKARIEGMMDQVVAGFEKQLDKLFQNDAMDISSDIKVLENMLKKDGLSDDQQTMTMPF